MTQQDPIFLTQIQVERTTPLPKKADKAAESGRYGNLEGGLSGEITAIGQRAANVVPLRPAS